MDRRDDHGSQPNAGVVDPAFVCTGAGWWCAKIALRPRDLDESGAHVATIIYSRLSRNPLLSNVAGSAQLLGNRKI
jgi:hypothetical protein